MGRLRWHGPHFKREPLHSNPPFSASVLAVFAGLGGVHGMIFVQWELGCGYAAHERLLGGSLACVASAWGFVLVFPGAVLLGVWVYRRLRRRARGEGGGE